MIERRTVKVGTLGTRLMKYRRTSRIGGGSFAITPSPKITHFISRGAFAIFALGILVASASVSPFARALPVNYSWRVANFAGSDSWKSLAVSSDGSKLAAVSLVGYISTSIDSGDSWTQQRSSGSRSWTAIAGSSDGAKLVAAASDGAVVSGYLYTSTDSGVTWTERASSGSRIWRALASSSDGTRLVAADYGSSMYTSTNSGATWTERAVVASGSCMWQALASSSDGTKLAVANNCTDDSYRGSIYTSTDSGVTWTEQTSAGVRAWSAVASSSDGTKLVAADYSSSIYRSTDSGATWTELPLAGNIAWSAVASSSDGSKLVATTRPGVIFASTDSGATWTEQTSAGTGMWSAVASSSDGSKLVAVKDYGPIYTSTDSGATWLTQPSPGLHGWRSIASSADNVNLIALSVNWDNSISSEVGSIYTSTDSGATWTRRATSTTHRWQSVASSVDGSKLVVVGRGWDSVGRHYYGSIHTSTDSGVTWTERVTSATHGWSSVASSADGSKLVATDYFGVAVDEYGSMGDGGAIYTSTDSGVTWTEQTSVGLHPWSSVASSADGSKLVATLSWGSIYTSTDSGVTWVERPRADFPTWIAVASSSDGSKLVAVQEFGSIYTSTDSGATWTEQAAVGFREWRSVASSADGSRLVAIAAGGLIYTSTDAGMNWVEQNTTDVHAWHDVAISADGSRFVVTESNGSIYFASEIAGPTISSFDLGTLDSLEHPVVSKSVISVSYGSCSTISTGSVEALSGSGIVAPEHNVVIVGGIGYDLSCAVQGGSADASITLGSHYSDLSKLRIYKKSASSSTVTDITDQVNLINSTDAGGSPVTIFSYTLVDGGAYDEDGIANGVIVDPIYIGLASNTASGGSSTVNASNTASGGSSTVNASNTASEGSSTVDTSSNSLLAQNTSITPSTLATSGRSAEPSAHNTALLLAASVLCLIGVVVALIFAVKSRTRR